MNREDLIIKDNVLLGCNTRDEELVVPEGVVAIKNRRFNAPKSLSLPASLTTFYPEDSQLPSVTKITVAAGNPKFKVVNNCLIDKTTDTLVFACNSTTENPSLKIPPVKHIGDYAVYRRRYRSIYIPSSVKTIGNFSFANCKVNFSVKFSDGLISIGNNAFEDCYLKELTLPDTLQSIGDNAFLRGCKVDELKIPDSVKSIGKYAFRECSAIKNAYMGKGLTTMGGYTFYNCKLYNDFYSRDNAQPFIIIHVPEGVTKIMPKAYANTTRYYVYIPKTVKEVGDYAFDEFGTVFYNGTKQQWEAIKKNLGCLKGVEVRCYDGKIFTPKY